jgi:hypothetical protein
MLHVKTFEQIFESSEDSIMKLSKQQKKTYIEILGKLVTDPYTFKKQPRVWQSIVNNGEQPDYEDLTPVQRDKHFHYQYEIDKVKVKIWGTPQATFNNFVGYAAGLGDDEGFPWEDMKTMSDKDYEMVFGQSDPEIIRIMRSLYNGFDVVSWIKIK